MKIYREPMFGLGFDVNRYHVRVWALCWIIVWTIPQTAKGAT